MFGFSKKFCDAIAQQNSYYQKYYNESSIVDWFNGEYSKQLIGLFPYESTIFITSNSDGLALFKTENSNLWPLSFNVLNLPNQIRHELSYFFTTTVMFMHKSCYPEFQMLQLAFISELNYLAQHCKLFY